MCNRITLFSALQKFTNSEKHFEHYFLRSHFHHLDHLNYFECFCHPVNKLKPDASVYIENILTLISICSFNGSHVGK